MYLAHPFPEKDKVREWELKTEKALDIELINPFFENFEDKWLEKWNEASKTPETFSKFLKSNNAKIVMKDLGAIDRSVGTVAFVPYPAIGVSMEIFYTGYVVKKPCLIYQPNLIYGVTSLHPWLLYCGKVYKTEDELLAGIKALKDE